MAYNHDSRRLRIRILRTLGSLGLALVVATTLALGKGSTGSVRADGNPNPGVLPTNSNAFGKSYGEWSAAWWQWVLSIPNATNPNFDTTGANCAQGQSGKVWFLAGTFGGAFTRSCTIPTGKAIFFPILTQIDGAAAFDCAPTVPNVACDLNTLRALAAAAEDNPTTLSVSIDGNSLQSLASYRVQSPVFSVTIPDDAVFGIRPGTYNPPVKPQVADGYYILLAPLSAGTHTIHVKGVASPANRSFVSEVTWNLTVK